MAAQDGVLPLRSPHFQGTQAHSLSRPCPNACPTALPIANTPASPAPRTGARPRRKSTRVSGAARMRRASIPLLVRLHTLM